MPSATDHLLENIKSAIAARVLRRTEVVRKVEDALAAYRGALEGQVATEYARDHALPSPKLSADPTATARALKAAVDALPELGVSASAAPDVPATGEAPEPRSKAIGTAPTRPEEALSKGPGPAPAAAPAVRVSTARATPRPGQATVTASAPPVEWGPLVRCLQGGPLVLVGGVIRSDRLGFLPREVIERLEWIDTTRQGTHAIGNLAQRIKARRVAALILMEGVIGHRHSDPVVHATREVGIPMEYAGKGGRNALIRALISINQKAEIAENGG